MSLRQHIYDRLAADAALNSLGLSSETLWAGQSAGAQVTAVADQRFFAIMNWGYRNAALSGQRGPLRSYEQWLDVYIYNKDDDYAPITKVLQRIQEMCDEIVAESTGSDAKDGYVSCAEWTGESQDSYDEVYMANMRYGSMTLVANGN
jgi:hypothetical protein